MHDFRYVKGRLHCEGVSIDSLIKKHGTPLYVYSSRTLTDHFRKLDTALAPLDHLVCFAMKSNSNQAVLRTLTDLGSGFDTVSGGEIQRVIAGGGDPRKCVFAGVGKTEDEIAYGQLRGLGAALAVISLVLLMIFRSGRLALLSLAPNAIPLLLIFGALGTLGLPLDAGTALIGCLALGVAVDDTIHIVAGFHARQGAGLAPREALDLTFAEVLPALASTTAMIAMAFLVLALSEFTIARNLGWVTSGIMVICFVADATLLPALLLRTKRGNRSERAQ